MKNKTLWNELNGLSEEQLRKLADLMDIGLNDPLDKDEIILILSTEPEAKILEAIQKL